MTQENELQMVPASQKSASLALSRVLHQHPSCPPPNPADPLCPSGGAPRRQPSGEGPAAFLSRREEGGGRAAYHLPAGHLLVSGPALGTPGGFNLIALLQEGSRDPKTSVPQGTTLCEACPSHGLISNHPFFSPSTLTALASLLFLHTSSTSCLRAFALASSWA